MIEPLGSCSTWNNYANEKLGCILGHINIGRVLLMQWVVEGQDYITG